MPKKDDKGKGAAGSYLENLYGEKGVGPDSELIQMLERDCVDRCPSVSCTAIAGLDQAKTLLEEAWCCHSSSQTTFRVSGAPGRGF